MSEDNFWHMSQCTREVRGQCFGVSSHPPCFWTPILLQKPTLGLQTQAVKSGFLKFHLGGNSSFSHTTILPALRNELRKIFLSPFPKELMELFKEMVQGGHCFDDGAEIPLSAPFRAHSMLCFPLWNSLYLKHPYTVWCSEGIQTLL